jgi:hypothetical protein
MNTALLTRVSAIVPSIVSKQYHLDNSGALVTTPGGMISEASIRPVRLESLPSLLELLTGLTAKDALIYGVTIEAATRIVTRKRLAQLPPEERHDVVTRTRENFSWPSGGGVMMIDYDPAPDETPLTPAELYARLDLASLGARVLWAPSSSSCIHNTQTNATVSGIRGQRFYFLVRSAADIPRAGQVLFDRCWLNGHGRVEVGAAGQMLVRGLIDPSVWGSERLDFAGAAGCHPPLERRATPQILGDADLPDWLDTQTALPNLSKTQEAQVKSAIERAKKDVEEEARSVRARFIADRADKFVSERGRESGRARDIFEAAVTRGVLSSEFLVTLDDGTQVSVGDILTNRSTYHGRETLDPIEPEYQHGKVTGKLYVADSRPTLFSQAHGGMNYRLKRQAVTMVLDPGGMTDSTEEVFSVLSREEDIYLQNEQLVAIEGGRIVPVTEGLAKSIVGKYIGFYKYDGRAKRDVPVNMPEDLVRSVLEGAAKRSVGLRPLDAMLDVPSIDAEGRVIQTPGYDEKTRTVYMPGQAAETFRMVNDNPTAEEVEEARNLLLFPFLDFPLASDMDWGLLVSALLSAVSASCVPAQPVYGFSAPLQGSGKTLLAMCVEALATGQEPTVRSAPETEEEWSKSVLSVLIGGTRSCILDNVTGFVNSKALAAATTSPIFRGRILGKSMEVDVASRCLWMITGNHLTVGTDIARRVLIINIEPQGEAVNVIKRHFDLDPKVWVLTHREEMVWAALTLMRAARNHPMEGGVASFPMWDNLIRRTVCFLGYPDPRDRIEESFKEGLVNDGSVEILRSLYFHFKGEKFTAKDVLVKMRLDADKSAASGGTAGEAEGYGGLDVCLEPLRRKGKDVGTMSLGWFLRNRSRTVHDGKRLVCAKKSNVSYWYVEGA